MEKSSYGFIAIVAIVAVVAVITMFSGNAKFSVNEESAVGSAVAIKQESCNADLDFDKNFLFDNEGDLVFKKINDGQDIQVGSKYKKVYEGDSVLIYPISDARQLGPVVAKLECACNGYNCYAGGACGANAQQGCHGQCYNGNCWCSFGYTGS